MIIVLNEFMFVMIYQALFYAMYFILMYNNSYL